MGQIGVVPCQLAVFLARPSWNAPATIALFSASRIQIFNKRLVVDHCHCTLNTFALLPYCLGVVLQLLVEYYSHSQSNFFAAGCKIMQRYVIKLHNPRRYIAAYSSPYHRERPFWGKNCP